MPDPHAPTSRLNNAGARLRPSDSASLDHSHLWHPFTQQQGWSEEEPLVIERAEGTDLIDAEGRRYIDGVSSLWCNVHGHRHAGIDKAVRDQLDRVAHSTMLGLTHGPAAELAARLVEIAPPGLNRVFYSDSGLDGDRDRAEDGVPVLAAAGRRGGEANVLRLPARRLPRRHGGRRLGRRHRPVPLRLRAAAVRRPPRRPGRRRGARVRARLPGGRDRGGHRRAARPGSGGDAGAAARLPAPRA